MTERFHIHELPNGLTLLGQPMDGVSSASMSVLIPMGAAHDPADAAGAAAVTAEWLIRGAGDRNSRQLNDALDALGCQHDESAQGEHLHVSTAQLGRNLPDILAIVADMLRRPRLEDDTFDPCRQLILQDLETLEDEPARKCNILLRERFYPHPLGRNVLGHADCLAVMQPADVRRHARAAMTPAKAILAVAGNIDWDRFVSLATQLFGDWQAAPAKPVDIAAQPRGETHIQKDTAQTHIAMAHASVTVRHPMYYAARVAEIVLSGGMSSRLFTEVREKRGLVYGVSSRYHSLKDYAGMFTYAGTRPEVAQTTFDVTVGEIRRLAEGVTADEMARARTQLKAALIMQGESTGARAGAIAADYYHLGRLRSLDEIAAAIEHVTADEVAEYQKAFPPDNLTVLVLGPEPVEIVTSH
ncbi:MAG: insulinase family protein [Phycisphaerae bacterium]|nr:insulinase family protein [Phycisphaerae bacterium]